MNAEEMIKNQPAPVAMVKRVRVKDGSCKPGVVFDVTEDGWLLWIGDDGFCHCSHPSYVEAVS